MTKMTEQQLMDSRQSTVVQPFAKFEPGDTVDLVPDEGGYHVYFNGTWHCNLTYGQAGRLLV